MIAKTVADRMRKLSHDAIAAYLFINLEADDDGVCQDVELALFRTKIDWKKSTEELIDKGFLYAFPYQSEDGPARVVVRHWWVNNSIPQSRRKKCGNEDFLELLELKGDTYFMKDEPIKPRLEATVSEPEPEPMLINEPKKQPKQPSREAWKHFVELTDRYPQITKTDADEKAAYKMYVQMLLKEGADYDAILKQFVKEIQAAVKTGEEGLLLTEIVERVRGDTG